jgi:hypothetical protein
MMGCSELLAHLNLPEMIGKVQHYGQDCPGVVVESETALMNDIRMATENAEHLEGGRKMA